MKKETLISSYDERNDTFVGKIVGRNGYCADYGISDGIFLSIGNDNIPSSVLVSNASEVFNVSKKVLENPNVKIGIDCDSICLNFSMFIEDLKIFSVNCRNVYGIPDINFELDSNS